MSLILTIEYLPVPIERSETTINIYTYRHEYFNAHTQANC